jgi:hypothetical protein
MFGSPDLSDAIRDAWKINPRPEFRAHLIRLVSQTQSHSIFKDSGIIGDKNSLTSLLRQKGLLVIFGNFFYTLDNLQKKGGPNPNYLPLVFPGSI